MATGKTARIRRRPAADSCETVFKKLHEHTAAALTAARRDAKDCALLADAAKRLERIMLTDSRPT